MNNFANLNVLVTGGAGFIGSHLTDALLQRGARVCVFDNFDPFYARKEKEHNLALISSHPQIEIREADILDLNTVRSVIREFKPSAIVHLAAKAGVRPSMEDPVGYSDVNVKGTTVILEAARATRVQSVVFASSSSVYGNAVTYPCREDERTDHPLSPYGATKKAGEVICHAYHHLYGLSVACLRFFTVYGPRQRPDLAIRKFVRLALRNEEIPVFGDGSSGRDYTHINDVLTGVLGAIEWVSEGQPKYGIFNLGSSHPVLLKELIQQIEVFVGRSLRLKHFPIQPGDVFHTFADTTLAEREIGFRHCVAFEDGLKDFVEWMRRNEYSWK